MVKIIKDIVSLYDDEDKYPAFFVIANKRKSYFEKNDK